MDSNNYEEALKQYVDFLTEKYGYDGMKKFVSGLNRVVNEMGKDAIEEYVDYQEGNNSGEGFEPYDY